MYHVMAWGLPFVAAVVGCDLVMPSRFLRPAVMARVIAAEQVTSSYSERVGGAVTRFLVAPPGVLESVEVPEGTAP